jgi:hypothetical protein
LDGKISGIVTAWKTERGLKIVLKWVLLKYGVKCELDCVSMGNMNIIVFWGVVLGSVVDTPLLQRNQLSPLSGGRRQVHTSFSGEPTTLKCWYVSRYIHGAS